MRPREPNRRKRASDIRRVYVVGAGFTAHMGYPLGGRLVDRIEGYLRGSPAAPGLRGNPLRRKGVLTKASVRRIRAGLARLRRLCGPGGGRNAPVDCAEFYTIAHMLSETPALLGESSRADPLPLMYDTLAAVTRTLFIDILRKVKGFRGFPAAIVKGIDPERHAVVNFNWDEEMDLALTARNETAYTLESWRAETDAATLMLKPHGSAGWYDAGHGIRNKQSYFICENDGRIPRRERRIIAYFAAGMPVLLDADDDAHLFGFPPVITPPTFRKEFRYAEQQVIWRDVATVMSGAEEFVFLGYSLPPDDYLTRAALRMALLRGRGKKVRCLVLTLDADSVLKNFQSVFGEKGFLPERNVMLCDFGKRHGAAGGVREMEAQLAGATVR
jgi:hypothetical protein